MNFNNKITFERVYEITDEIGGKTTVWAILEKLNVGGIEGTFKLDEKITGGTSNATAYIGKVGADYLEIYTRSDTDFQKGETIAGGTSSAEAKITSIVTLKNIACRLQPYSGRERYISGKTGAFVTYGLFMRVPAISISEKDRVKFGSRTFEIDLVKNWDEADRYYKLSLVEIT